MALGGRQYGGGSAVIPRYQTVLFFILLVASLVMTAVLWQLRDRNRQRLLQVENSLPTQAPEAAPEQQATLYVANDADDSMTAEALTLPLPSSPNERARAILGKLLDLYAATGSTHPVPGGAASIAQVHAATLKTGEPVVVKVQRPRVGALVKRDLAAMSWIAPALIGRIPVSALANPPAGARYWACQCGRGEAEEQTRGYGMRRSVGRWLVRVIGPWVASGR